MTKSLHLYIKGHGVGLLSLRPLNRAVWGSRTVHAADLIAFNS